MTRYEQVKRAIHFQKPDYVPLFLFNGDRSNSDIIQTDLVRFYLGEDKQGTEWGFRWESDDPSIPMGNPKNPPLEDFGKFDEYNAKFKPDAFDKSRFADIIEGTYKINLLEPRCWDTDADPYDVDAPKAFRQSTRLAQHTSFLKDVFRTYKDFTTAQIDTIEIMLTKLYTEWGITEETDFSQMRPEDYPILSELYDFIEIEYENFDETKPQLYTRETLQQILLGLHSMCRGADSKFFNGHTNLTSTRFLVFGVKGLLSVAQNVRSTILLNLLSYMSDKLLTEGNTVAALDELYIWLSNPVAIEYIRNFLKRVRKKESALVLASQNLEDFDQPGVREMTKPLFSIPPHQFLFNAGSIDRRAYMDMLQLEDSEFDLIKFPQRGVCLYKCGNERYLLEVHAPPYKEALFGKAGGR